MNIQQAVTALAALTDDDTEVSHSEADQVLLAVLRSYGLGEVAEAWVAARVRVPFHYS